MAKAKLEKNARLATAEPRITGPTGPRHRPALLRQKQSWLTVQQALEAAPHQRTRRQILNRWPPDVRPPEESTVWKWLDQALEKGLVCREGTGRKNDPFYRWLPGQREK